MVKILAFPGLKAVHRADARPVHADSDPLISVMADGVVVSVTPGDAARRAAADWDNQELAGLYRVEGLLVQANIHISTGRGVSDEGDPWFVFCREDGDVFVHLARIDGSYLLDSPGLTEVLHGADFAELISRFVRQIANKTTAAASNVVALRPRVLQDQTIRLHPSVMLAALIWSLYVASDDFVGAAQAMGDMASQEPTPAELASTLAANGEALSPELTLMQLSERIGELGAGGPPLASEPVVQAPGETAKHTSATAGDRSATGAAPAPLLAQGVAASLALIAVGYGFYAVSDTLAPEVGTAQAATPAEHDIVLASASDGDLIDLDGHSSGDAQHLPVSFAGIVDTSQTLKFAAVEPGIKAPDTPLTSEARETAKPALVDTPNETPAEVAALDAPVKAARPDAKSAAPAAVAGSGKTPVAASSDAAPSESQFVLTLVNQYVGVVSDYKVGELIVSTTLDYSGLDKLLTRITSDKPDIDVTPSGPTLVVGGIDTPDASTLPTLPLPGPILSGAALAAALGPQFAYYDDYAKSFVSQFIRGAEKIEMVQFNLEIVLVDMTAIDDPTDIAYTRRWVTDDGHVISTIGHLQDFLDFGIA